ncbi:unnamed protein product, partial [Iphiclides podalirius]
MFDSSVLEAEELARNIKFQLVYTNFIHFGSNILPPNVIEVGGYHAVNSKQLPDNIRKFIEDSEHGVIYISFGSMLKAASTPRDKIETIISALTELPQRAIWKWEEDSLPGNPKNIYLSKWLPQNDILGHPNVLAFYSHCGLLSTTEAMYHGVPMLAMPIFGDQPANAAAVEESGLGVQIELKELTKENLLQKFKKILNPQFRAEVKSLSRAWRDRPTSAMDSAVHWTEFAARHRNFTFRSPAADVPVYQYLCLDVLFVLFGVPIYLRELANRGHNVTVISHFPEKDPPKNYHDISLAGSIKILEDDMPLERSFMTILQVAIFLTTSGKENCEVMLANENVQGMIERKPKFDVVVVEQFNSDCALGIAYKLNAPVVGITSHILMPWHYSRLGIPNNPSYVSFHFLEGGTKPTFAQRLERVVFDLYFKTIYYLVSQRSDQNTLARYFDDIPPLEDLAREIKFLLLYHNFILTGSSLFPANVIEIGGYHVQKAKPLTGELRKFVEEAEHGVIYISFGSVIKSSTLPSSNLEAILGAIRELPQRFIWRFDNKTLLVDNENKLYVDDWLPQVDILNHPKTLAFFSHAGMGGTTEALHFGVPMVAMPVFGDQPANAASIEESGLGVQLHIRDLTKQSLVAALKTVMEPKFSANVKLVSKAWHDRPMPPLDTAIYWTEFAARYSNLTFRTAAADVPWYQYTNLDVALRCGWRPGHISCSVLKKIERHNCTKTGECAPCSRSCSRPTCLKPCCNTPKCISVCPSTNSCLKQAIFGQPLIRIIRHGGQYSICTKPSKISNAPSGPYPLKYVLNTVDTDNPEDREGAAKYSVEAKFNDYQFDYTSSQSSFVLDFSPPNQKCYKTCPKSATCMLCEIK